MSEMPALLERLIRLIDRIPLALAEGDKDWRRLRIAVSPREWDEIESYLFGRDGYSLRIIRGIIVVIDPEPVRRSYAIRLPSQYPVKG